MFGLSSKAILCKLTTKLIALRHKFTPDLNRAADLKSQVNILSKTYFLCVYLRGLEQLRCTKGKKYLALSCWKVFNVWFTSASFENLI